MYVEFSKNAMSEDYRDRIRLEIKIRDLPEVLRLFQDGGYHLVASHPLPVSE